MKKAVLQFAICNFFYALWIVCVFGVLVLISAPASESETWKERTEPPVKWSGSPKEGGRTIEKLLHRHLTDGTTYLEEGKWDEAIAEFQQALKISSNHLHAHMNLGIAYQEKQMWDEAIVEYEKVILLDPNLAFAYNNLGLVYWRKGQHQTAIFSLKKAISLDPERANGYANLGMVYISQSMLKEAITEFETALEISPDLETIRKNLAIAHLNLGINHYNEGIFTEARSELNKALELDPEFSEVKDLIEDIEKIERERKLAAEEGTGRQPGKGLGVSYQVAGDLKPWEATVQWRKNVFT